MEFGIDEGVLAFPWVPVLGRLAGKLLRACPEPHKTRALARGPMGLGGSCQSFGVFFSYI